MPSALRMEVVRGVERTVWGGCVVDGLCVVERCG